MIRLEDVQVRHGEKVLCRKCNLKVKPQERLVVLGASGSGKTTLLRLIAGFEVPSEGKVIIDGCVVSSDGVILVPSEERGVGMVFQDLALWPHMNVEENISFALKMQGVGKKQRLIKVREMLTLIGLEGYEKRAIEKLSGGEQQRVALARALVLSPKVLLMDEPLSSVDHALNVRLREEIIRLQNSLKFTLIYVTHNEEEAEAIATQTVLMEDLV